MIDWGITVEIYLQGVSILDIKSESFDFAVS